MIIARARSEPILKDITELGSDPADYDLVDKPIDEASVLRPAELLVI
jgi:hypothetical protein